MEEKAKVKKEKKRASKGIRKHARRVKQAARKGVAPTTG